MPDEMQRIAIRGDAELCEWLECGEKDEERVRLVFEGSDVGLDALVGSPRANQLGQLYLSGYKISDVGLNSVAMSKNLGELRYLCLNGCKITATGCKGISRKPTSK